MDIDNGLVIKWGEGIRALNDNGNKVQYTIEKKRKPEL